MLLQAERQPREQATHRLALELVARHDVAQRAAQLRVQRLEGVAAPGRAVEGSPVCQAERGDMRGTPNYGMTVADEPLRV